MCHARRTPVQLQAAMTQLRSTRICPVCNKQATTKDELALDAHKRKGGEICLGSGTLVDGLKPGSSAPAPESDQPEAGNTHHREDCPVCGELCAVESSTGIVYPHLNSTSGIRCSQSGRTLYLIAHGHFAVSRRISCPACGDSVQASRISGRIYSHSLPGTSFVCQGSGRDGIEPDAEGTELIPQKRVEPPHPVRPIASDEGTATSVWTVSGGLPGSGRRR